MSEVVLRRAFVADAAAVAHVHRHARAAYYGTSVDDDDREQMWTHLLEEPERFSHVAEADGAVIGFLSTKRLPEPDPALEMTSIYVLPDHFGSGVGALLHDEFVRQLQDGEDGVLEVWAGNERAIAFYRQRGWRATEVTRPGPQGCDYVAYRLNSHGASDDHKS